MTTPTTSTVPMRAGGRATEAGMAFQAAVATWFAVHILVRMPVGGRFGINNEATPSEIRLETGNGLDDVEISQSDGGSLHIQCKTTANLGTGENSSLTKTIIQLAQWVADSKAADGLPDLTRNAALLAVGATAAQTLDNLESGCRAFSHAGDWSVTISQRNQAERTALKAFETIAIPAWTKHCGAAPADDDLVDMARIFRIARFTMDEGDSDWREASRLLGRHLYGHENSGDAALRDLKGIMRELIENGAPANRSGLLRALRNRGHHDIGAPGFESDISNLQAATNMEIARLAIHGRLPIGEGTAITRESDGPLIEAILSGSLLVVGEPGAGKTGALVHAAETIAANDNIVVFLSVDRFSGVAIAADLLSELSLTHSMVETLDAMPGDKLKVLFIDALDATRGGPSESVFASLIEDIRKELAEDWTVVASIRTFDLKNGHRFRQAFAGTPANQNYADTSLSQVRHFLVPRLSENDLVEAGSVVPELGSLLTSVPSSLTELLRNIFNLSLATQLLADGADSETFCAIRTQSGLIDAYEDIRLRTTSAQQAAAAAARIMANRCRLSVRKVLIEHAALDDVIQTGVLTESGDLVSFAHHVLFDHIAGRFHLEWDQPDALITQLNGNTSIALILAPALRFAVERLWRTDKNTGHPLSWQLAAGIFSESNVDPVLGNVTLRTITENIENEQDIAGLTTIIATSANDPTFTALMRTLASFAAMDIEMVRPGTVYCAIAWARIAEALVATNEHALAHPARVLLFALFKHSDLENAALLHIFGHASRQLLEFAWQSTPPLVSLSDDAIRFVGKSFASDPDASRALLSRILQDPHFSLHADHEATWLAEQIIPITHADPEFSVDIYTALYSQTINDNSASWLGGQPSRIFSLSSNRRQDYEHSRWELGTAMGKVLEISPSHGTRALINALIGKTITEYIGINRDPENIYLGCTEIELRGHYFTYDSWHEKDDDSPRRKDDLLENYELFLRNCSPEHFKISVEEASRDYTCAPVLARIFGIGSERIEEVGDFLWPLIQHSDVFENSAISRETIRFLVSAWPSRTREDRIQFETMALNETRFSDKDDLHRWHRTLSKFFAQVEEDLLELEAMRELRNSLKTAGFHTDNTRIRITENSEYNSSDYMREELRRTGIDIDTGPNRLVIDSSDELKNHLDRISSDSSTFEFAALWRDITTLLTLLDANPGLHEQIDRSAWIIVANATEMVASNPNYEPGVDGLPEVTSVFAILQRLSLSRYPEPSEPEHLGNMGVRGYAAEAWVALAQRFAGEYPLIVDHLEEILVDPVPSVRLQVAQDLQVICEAAPGRMWSMAERFVTHEMNIKVLASYLSRSMRLFSESTPERCEGLLGIVKERLNNDLCPGQDGRDLIQNALGSWVAQLYVAQGRELMHTWLEEWAVAPQLFSSLLKSLASSLRAVLFYRYQPEARNQDRAICDRAQESLSFIITQAIRVSDQAYREHSSDLIEEENQLIVERYKAAEKVIHHVMDQFYFGSGAYKGKNMDSPGLPDSNAMSLFLADYNDILAQLARSHEPATLHELIELYEFLIPSDPVAVFDAIHNILHGRGEEEGYHYESLGNSAVVRIVKRYIADHRVIFENEDRRDKLLSILQLFSKVGWRDSLRLLYELPDLLR
ncbi:hypothetical protein [Desulfuromonas acetoxidans]|uniref:hypothetical protein n=1 Tax=Desulfuromonas acetoxidans TaxID=891 RepID=UPI002930B0C4|nr:hypothetical protein [Desulfuromonas acetoxidans]